MRYELCNRLLTPFVDVAAPSLVTINNVNPSVFSIFRDTELHIVCVSLIWEQGIWVASRDHFAIAIGANAGNNVTHAFAAEVFPNETKTLFVKCYAVILEGSVRVVGELNQLIVLKDVVRPLRKPSLSPLGRIGVFADEQCGFNLIFTVDVDGSIIAHFWVVDELHVQSIIISLFFRFFVPDAIPIIIQGHIFAVIDNDEITTGNNIDQVNNGAVPGQGLGYDGLNLPCYYLSNSGLDFLARHKGLASGND